MILKMVSTSMAFWLLRAYVTYHCEELAPLVLFQMKQERFTPIENASDDGKQFRVWRKYDAYNHLDELAAPVKFERCEQADAEMVADSDDGTFAS